MSLLPQLTTRTESSSRTPILCPARSQGRAFLSLKASVSGPNHRTLLSWTPAQQAPPLTPPWELLLPTPHHCSPLVLEEQSIKMPPSPLMATQGLSWDLSSQQQDLKADGPSPLGGPFSTSRGLPVTEGRSGNQQEGSQGWRACCTWARSRQGNSQMLGWGDRGEHLFPNNKLPVNPVGLRCPWDVRTLDGRVHGRRQRSGLPQPTPEMPLDDSASWKSPPAGPATLPALLARPLASGTT